MNERFKLRSSDRILKKINRHSFHCPIRVHTLADMIYAVFLFSKSRLKG